jgi:hypothetical protein
VVPGDYVYCQLSWLNIDPGAAENAQLYVTFSEYLEFVDSSVPVIIDGDSFIFETGLIQFKGGGLPLLPFSYHYH